MAPPVPSYAPPPPPTSHVGIIPAAGSGAAPKGVKRPAPVQVPVSCPATRGTKASKTQSGPCSGAPHATDSKTGKAGQAGSGKPAVDQAASLSPGHAGRVLSPSAKAAAHHGAPATMLGTQAAAAAAVGQPQAQTRHSNGSQQQAGQPHSGLAETQKQHLAAQLMQRLHSRQFASQQQLSQQQQQVKSPQQHHQPHSQPPLPLSPQQLAMLKIPGLSGVPGMLPAGFMSGLMPVPGGMMMPTPGAAGMMPVSGTTPAAGLVPAPGSSGSVTPGSSGGLLPAGMIPTNVGSLMPSPRRTFSEAHAPGGPSGMVPTPGVPGASMQAPMQPPMQMPMQPALPAGWAPAQPSLPYGMVPQAVNGLAPGVIPQGMVPQGMVPTPTTAPAGPQYPPNPWGTRQPPSSSSSQQQQPPDKTKRMVSLSQVVHTQGA